jgi:hypothetical protein
LEASSKIGQPPIRMPRIPITLTRLGVSH